jgi:hypothetical protein
MKPIFHSSMALHVETSIASASRPLLSKTQGNQAEMTGRRSLSTGSILAMTVVTRRKRNVRNRTVVLAFMLILALAVLTGSVLLIGYVAAAASLLTGLTLFVKRAIGGEPTAPIESFIPRWVDAEDREAA